MFVINCNKLQSLKNLFFEKNCFCFFVAVKSSKQCPKIWFKKNESWDILDFNDFKFSKLIIHNKIINKNRMKKDPENSTHCFWDNYFRKLSREISAKKDETVESLNF